MKPTPIEKYQYLTHLRATNVHLFYRLLAENIKVSNFPGRLKLVLIQLQELTPLIYTPTVGEACVRWHEIFTQPEGLYLSYNDRGNLRSILNNWPHNAEIT